MQCSTVCIYICMKVFKCVCTYLEGFLVIYLFSLYLSPLLPPTSPSLLWCRILLLDSFRVRPVYPLWVLSGGCLVLTTSNYQ